MVNGVRGEPACQPDGAGCRGLADTLVGYYDGVNTECGAILSSGFSSLRDHLLNHAPAKVGQAFEAAGVIVGQAHIVQTHQM